MKNHNRAAHEQGEKEKTQGNNVADELQLQSDIEASEQRPLNDNPVEKLSAELAEQKDQYLRLYAEFDNYRKRSVKERMELLKSAGADTVITLLPVMDDFERALKAAGESNENDALYQGVFLIYNKLKAILEQKGLKPMDSVGKDFDVDLHEAITGIPVDEKKKGKVLEEIEKGYLLNDKVIRHAKVVVGN